MAVRSDRLGGPLLTTAGGVVVATCPAGETWIVKRVTSRNNAALSSGMSWSIQPDGLTEGAVYQPVVAGADTDDHETWWVLDPGAILRAASPGGPFVVFAFGAKLSGAAA